MPNYLHGRASSQQPWGIGRGRGRGRSRRGGGTGGSCFYPDDAIPTPDPEAVLPSEVAAEDEKKKKKKIPDWLREVVESKVAEKRHVEEEAERERLKEEAAVAAAAAAKEAEALQAEHPTAIELVKQLKSTLLYIFSSCTEGFLPSIADEMFEEAMREAFVDKANSDDDELEAFGMELDGLKPSNVISLLQCFLLCLYVLFRLLSLK
jgi:hypothetical protein